MSDATAPVLDQKDQQATKPSPAGHAIREALEQLRHALPAVAETDKRLAGAVETLLKQAADPARINESVFPYKLAYVLQDVERAGHQLGLPQQTRQQVERWAQSAPGLENRDMLNLLKEARHIEDRVLIRDIRLAAAEIGRQPDQDSPSIRERVEVLQNRVRLASPPSPAAGTSNTQAIPPHPPSGRHDGADPRASAQAFTRTGPSQPHTQPGHVAVAVPSGQVAAAGNWLAGQASEGAAKAQAIVSGMLRGFRPLGSSTTQPWEPAPTPFGERLNAFEQRLSGDRADATLRNLEKSGRAALDALRGFSAGEGAVMLNRIREATNAEPGGITAVLSEMRPGGKFEALRQQFNNAFADEKGFAAAYEKAASALSAYGQGRAGAAELIGRQPDATNIAAQFESMDRDIGAAASEIPSRRDGKSLLQDAGRQIVEIVQRALEGVKNLFSRSPATGASSSPSPS